MVVDKNGPSPKRRRRSASSSSSSSGSSSSGSSSSSRSGSSSSSSSSSVSFIIIFLNSFFNPNQFYRPLHLHANKEDQFLHVDLQQPDVVILQNVVVGVRQQLVAVILHLQDVVPDLQFVDVILHG